MNEGAAAASLESALCRGCGACCAFSRTWPRFTTDGDVQLERIPAAFLAADGRGMRCAEDRCSALAGAVGVATACLIYAIRPDVCRACAPGDEACNLARHRFGLERVVAQETTPL